MGCDSKHDLLIFLLGAGRVKRTITNFCSGHPLYGSPATLRLHPWAGGKCNKRLLNATNLIAFAQQLRRLMGNLALINLRQTDGPAL